MQDDIDFHNPKANRRLHGIYSRIIKTIRDTPPKQKCDLIAITNQVMGGPKGYPYVNAALNTMAEQGLIERRRSPECGATGRYRIIADEDSVDQAVARMDVDMPNEADFRAFLQSEAKRAQFAARMEAERKDKPHERQ
jgi:hypothetical protein